jgi:hypothetical protein
MNPNPFRISTVAISVGVALALGVVLLSTVRSQATLQVTPNFAPIGVASSGSSSTAWFHEPSTGRAMACQTAPTAGGPSPIQCVTVKLPRAEP